MIELFLNSGEAATALFLDVLNMSISALWLIGAVLVLRLALKKAPKWIHVLLWAVVAVRLVCPFSIESALSLIPSTQTVSPEIMMSPSPTIDTGIEAVNNAVNPIIQASFTPHPAASANPLQILIPVASAFWLMGMAVMALYTLLSYALLCRKVSSAVRLKKNIYQSEAVGSPFVLGLIRPRIYLPFSMSESDIPHVIAHERAHIRRKDHWWKPLGFLVLTVHWFNPVVWFSYILLCRDIELACDEKVIREMGCDQQADYSQALLNCSVHRRSVAACPLAFGEVGVKQRVSNILNYKKPAFWVILIAVALCIVVAVCFLTDPKRAEPPFGQDWYIDSFLYQNTGETRASDISLDGNYSLSTSELNVFLQAQYRLTKDREFMVMEAPESGKWAHIGQFEEEHLSMLNFDEYFKNDDIWYTYLYRPEKFRETYSKAWRLDVNPHGAGLFYLLLEMEDSGYYLMCGYDQQISTPMQDEESTMYWVAKLTEVAPTPGNAVCWVDYLEDGSYPDGEANYEATLPEFPDVTFHYIPGEVSAVKDGERSVLISGMPIWNVFFCDLTGDDIPELCATVSYGSGIIDEHVVVYDYATGMQYTLWDRGHFDFTLRLERGKLICDQWFYPHKEIADSGVLMLTSAGGGDGMRLEINSGDVKEEDSSMVSFEHFDFSSVTDIKLTNAHNGKSTAIADPDAVKAICNFLSGVSGSNGRNSKGHHYQGTYALTLMAGEETVLQITFGDEDVFFYGMYDEFYSMMYDLEWYTMDDILHFFYHYDETGFDWGFKETMVVVEVTPYEVTSAIPEDGLRADIEYLTEGDVIGYGLLKEERRELAILLNNLMPEAFEEPVDYTPTMKVNLSWDGGRLTLYTDGKQTVFGEDGQWAVRTEDINRFLARFDQTRNDYDTPNAYPLDQIPKYYNQEQAMIDGCVGILDLDVRFGAEHFTAFAESAASGIPSKVRIVSFRSEEPYATSIADITFDGEGYLWQTYEDGMLREKRYQYMYHFSEKAESPGATYDAFEKYVLTDAKNVTWHDLWYGLFSSASDAYIDHTVIYNDYIYYPDYPEIPNCREITLELDGKVLLTVTQTDALEELFANAEALGYEPKTYLPGPTLRFKAIGGMEVIVTLMLDSDLCIIDGVFYDFGPGYDNDGSLNNLPKLFELLSMQDWPREVKVKYPDYFYYDQTLVYEAFRSGDAQTFLDRMCGMDWSAYSQLYGMEVTMDTLELLSKALSGLPLESISLDTVASYTRNLDGAYSEGFASIIGDLYERDPEWFAEEIQSLDTAASAPLINMLAYDLGVDTEDIRSTLNRLVLN